MQLSLRVRGMLAVAVLGCISCPALADFTDTWDGGGSNDDFGTANNWADNSQPVTASDSDLHFAGSTRLTPNNNYGSFNAFRHFFFDSGAGSFTIGGNPID